jgi:four helix bundle protein
MRFIAMALGSVAELRTHCIISYELQYLKKETLSELELECDVLGKQLQALYNSMERKACA